MGEKETTFRVTGRLNGDYQMIVQTNDAEEAAYFATDIDSDKWREFRTDRRDIEAVISHFLKVVKSEST